MCSYEIKKFYKGKGGQDKCYEDNPSCAFFVCKEEEYTKDGETKIGKTYGAFKDIYEFFEYNSVDGKSMLYEQLCNEYVELYDIDGTRDSPLFKDKTDIEIVNTFINARRLYGKHACINNGWIDDKDILVKRTPDPAGKKVSFHIIIRNGYKFRNNKEAKCFMKYFKSFITENGVDTTFDISIYSKNRNIRTIGSHKAGQPDRVAVPFKEYNYATRTAKKEDFYASFINDKDCKYIDSPYFTLKDKKETKPTEPIELVSYDTVSKLVNLICACIDKEEHSLCDYEYPNKMCYNDWYRLILTCFNCCDNRDAYQIYKKLFDYYRHADDIDFDKIYNDLLSYKGKYDELTVKSLHYYARENEDYQKEFEEELKEFKNKKNIQEYNLMLDIQAKKENKIEYIHDIKKLAQQTIKLDKLADILNEVIKICCNAGNTVILVKDKDFIDKTKENFTNWAPTTIDALCKKGGALGVKIKLINEKYEAELDAYNKLDDKDRKKKPQPQKFTLRCIGTKKKGCLLEALIEDGKINHYNKVVYIPYFDKPRHTFYDECFNQFQPFSMMKYLDTVSPDIYKNGRYRAHVKNQLCNGDELVFDYVEKYIAHMLQKPWERPDVCIMFISDQGIGKDMLAESLSRMVGENHMLRLNSVSQLLRKFNSQQQGVLFTILNEISDKGATDETHDRLKEKITAITQNIEPKNINPYSVNHFSRYFAFSNNNDGVKIEYSDRRFVLIKTNNEMCNNLDYFTPLWEDLDNPEFIRSMFVYYATLDIKGYTPRRIVETEYKKQIKINNLNNPVAFILELCRNEEELFNTEGKYIIHTESLYASFCSYCTKVGVKSCARKTFVGHLGRLKLHEHGSRITINNSLSGKRNSKNGYILDRGVIETLFKKYLRDDGFTF